MVTTALGCLQTGEEDLPDASFSPLQTSPLTPSITGNGSMSISSHFQTIKSMAFFVTNLSTAIGNATISAYIFPKANGQRRAGGDAL
jgi:hypothetical protein